MFSYSLINFYVENGYYDNSHSLNYSAIVFKKYEHPRYPAISILFDYQQQPLVIKQSINMQFFKQLSLDSSVIGQVKSGYHPIAWLVGISDSQDLF